MFLREALLGSAASFVWKTAREATAAPAPLADFSEASWCKLIFGGSFCQVCTSITLSVLCPTLLIVALRPVVPRQGERLTGGLVGAFVESVLR